MDKKTYEQAKERLSDVNGVIAELDPAIREAAFEILAPYVTSGISAEPMHSDGRSADDDESGTGDGGSGIDFDKARAFLAEHQSDKPADNAKAITAFLYGAYGTSSFTADNVDEIAHESGVTVPTNVTNTLKAASSSGRKLFSQVKAGSSEFRPTVNGEKYFKETYGVTKGTQRRPEQ